MIVPTALSLLVALPACGSLVGSKAVVAADTIVADPRIFIGQRVESAQDDTTEIIAVRALPPLDHLHRGSKFLTWADAARTRLVGGVVATVRNAPPEADGTPVIFVFMDMAATAQGDVFDRIDLDQTDTTLAATPELCTDTPAARGHGTGTPSPPAPQKDLSLPRFDALRTR